MTQGHLPDNEYCPRLLYDLFQARIDYLIFVFFCFKTCVLYFHDLRFMSITILDDVCKNNKEEISICRVDRYDLKKELQTEKKGCNLIIMH